MIAPETLLQNRYLVVEQIGQGGMGAVYRATDQRFGSTVALKETFFTDPNLRRAFEREAHLLNRLRHPALPRVSDHFSEAEGQFLVMEFIPGEDLSELLKRRGGAFPAREVLEWADQLLDALDYLHTQEPPVVHRDIKPQNLKLATRNQIILLDFGLAKGTPLQTRATTTGSIFGYSFNYAPLEQMQGAGTDPRSDLYSLGATLYHLLTGTTPPDALTRANSVLNDQTDPLRPAHEVNAQVPAEVSAALTRAMALNSAQRPASAVEMRETLRGAGHGTRREETAATVTTPLAAAASEHDTQLMEARATGYSPPAPVVSAPPLPAKEETNPASIVTRAGHASADAPRRRFSRRALGLAASVVLVTLVGAGLYLLNANRATNDGTPQPAPTEQPTPQTLVLPDPQTHATPESLPAALPSTTPADTPSSTSPKAAAPAIRNVARPPEPKSPAEDKPVVKAAPTPPPAVEPPGDINLEGRDFPNGPLSPRERRALRRRGNEEEIRAFVLRQQALREERLRDGQRRRMDGPRRRRGLPSP